MRGAFLSALAAVALGFASPARADGSFNSSDDLLTRIWQASVTTADDDVSPPQNLDPRDCNISLPVVILDSPIRDRCPYIGDLAVTGMTLLVSGGDVQTLRAMIAWFASVQHPDGSIPDGPIFNHTDVLTDYNAYWVEALYDYTLYTGDLTLLHDVLPNLVALMNVLYPAHVDANGILVNWIDGEDYGYIKRAGTRVAYYAAQYVRALNMASTLAGWAGDSADAAAWHTRAQTSATAVGATFWDTGAGAFSDTTTAPAVHALDGNVFAILAGVATVPQQTSILAYIDHAMSRAQGDAVVDTPSWNNSNWHDDATQHIYPFIGYFDVLARYAAGADDSALDLIRREWGYMLANGPGTMWETIDAADGAPWGNGTESHGWSSGAAPALTGYVLGVLPTSPGFGTFTVTPHPSDVATAEGDVPTPHGAIHVFWQSVGGTPQLSVTAPSGTSWSNNPAGASAPVNTVEPSISGSAVQGSALAVSGGSWAGAGPPTLAYQWDRCSSAGWGCAPIAGASAATYTVQPDDLGGTLRVFMTGTNGSGSSSAVTTATVVPVPSSGGGGGGGAGSAPAPTPPVVAPSPPPPPVPAPVAVVSGALPAAPVTVSGPTLFRLAVTVVGKGRVLPGPGRFRRGTRITLTARPSSGWRFVRWSGKWCSGSRPHCIVTMSQGRKVEAVFSAKRKLQAPRTRR